MFSIEGSEINLALNKPAYLGNQVDRDSNSSLYAPWRAVDGVYTNQGSRYDSAAISQPPYWFVVDLGGWYVVKRINLFTRISCCGEGMSKFSVGLLTEFNQTNFIRNELCGRFPHDTETNKNYTLHCKQPYPVTRFLSIFRNYDIPFDIGITELEVYGKKYDLTMRNYVGCYEGSIVEKEKKLSSSHQCISHCLSLDYQMAAFKIVNNSCHCVKTLGIKLSNLMCSNICPNNKLLCGGNDTQYSVYKTNICVNPISHKEEHCEYFCGGGEEDFIGGKCSPGGCKPGYKGDACDKRDCNKNRGGCGNQLSCVTENLKDLQISDCFCNQGYEGAINSTCLDINECDRGLDKCDSSTSNCLNTEGSYECLCFEGLLKVDKFRCERKNSNTGSILAGVFGFLLCVSLATLIPITIYLFKKNRSIK